jgi:hypothetical protein
MRWRVAAVFGLSALVLTAFPGAAVAASRGADRRIAEAGIITASDFPTGWTEIPDDRSADREIEAAAKETSSCKHYLTLRTTGKKQPRAESPTFVLGESELQNTVMAYPSTSGAKAAMKLFEHPSVLTCFNELFTKLLEDDGIQIAVEPVDVQDVGDAVAAYEGMATNGEASIGVGTAAVRVGRAIAVYSYVVDRTDVVELLPEVVDSSIARLTDALA